MLSFHFKFVQTDRQTDGQTDGWTDRRTTVKQQMVKQHFSSPPPRSFDAGA